jgi:predicted branched-subunit amino acid permease
MTTITRHNTGPKLPTLPAPVATGAADIAPMIVGLIPFALAIGASAAANGLTLFETVAGAWLLLAGSAQLAAVNLIGADADVWLTIATTAIINLRFVLYGAGVARWFGASPPLRRMLLAIPVVDQSFLLCEQRFTDEHDQRWRTSYYLTLTGSLIAAFVIGQVVGFGVGAGLPAGLGLHLAAPLAFVGMLSKSLANRAGRRAALAAAVGVIAVTALPIAWMASLALPVAIAAGVTASGVTGARDASAGDTAAEATAADEQPRTGKEIR